jgi:hypothetical protein
MKLSMLLRVTLMMAFTALATLAADVTGTWTGQVANPDGEMVQVSYTFKQADAKVTGAVAGPQGDPTIAIAEGKVEGDKISFNVPYNGMTIKHEGAIKGDEIKLALKADQGDFPNTEVLLKRSK